MKGTTAKTLLALILVLSLATPLVQGEDTNKTVLLKIDGIT